MEMQSRRIDVGAHELDVFENTLPCILGFQKWKHRQKVMSGEWDDPRVGHAITTFENDGRRIVLGDLTGIMDALLERMVSCANLAVAMGRDYAGLCAWVDFFELRGIPVVQKIISFLDKNKPPKISLPEIMFIGGLKSRVLRNDNITRLSLKLLEAADKHTASAHE